MGTSNVDTSDGYQISVRTMTAVCVEAYLAHIKHAPNGGSILRPETPTLTKLAALGEEFGEVSRLLTYDTVGTVDRLRIELIQLASVALTWVDSLDVDTQGHLINPAHRAVVEHTT